MKIIDLTPDNKEAIQQVAALLVAGFKEHYPRAYQDVDSSLEEVHESFAKDRISRVAIDEEGYVLGWIGGIWNYYGLAWELHPLVVDPARQGEGIGSALVADLEEQVRARGGVTIYLGTDDEDNQTSLANKDLYPDVWKHVNSIRNLRRHPYEFYQKQGYAIVGVIPDANGFGKPDIIMAKRVVNF